VIETILTHLNAKAAGPEGPRRPPCRAPPRLFNTDLAHGNSEWATSSITLGENPTSGERYFLVVLPGMSLKIVNLKLESLPQQYGTSHT